MRGGHLMVFISDRLSDLVDKGEVLPRYYNPGDLFERVTIVVSNWRDSDIDASLVQPMAGSAHLEIIQHTLPFVVTSFGWRFIDRWLRRGVERLVPLKPDLVWTLGCFQHGQLGARVSRAAGVPMITSLHGRWDVDERQSLPRWIYSKLRVRAEEESLRTADLVIPVYADIIPYAQKRGARRIEVVYNTINAAALVRKQDYALSQPARLLTINRQVPQKDPSNILRALAEGDFDCSLDVIGNGPIHARLESLVNELGLSARVRFIPAMPNKQVCALMHSYDVLLGTCHYHGISKGSLEAGYVGLPIVLNQRRPEPIQELKDDWMVVVEDSVAGYRSALTRLLSDEALRRRLGEAAHAKVRDVFRPQEGESRRAHLFAETAGQTADQTADAGSASE